MSPLKCSWGSADKLWGSRFFVGRIFLGYFWVAPMGGRFCAVFSRPPCRITRRQGGFGGHPRQKCAAGENWRKLPKCKRRKRVFVPLRGRFRYYKLSPRAVLRYLGYKRLRVLAGGWPWGSAGWGFGGQRTPRPPRSDIPCPPHRRPFVWSIFQTLGV